MTPGQIGILLLGVTAVWLSQSPMERSRAYAPIFGLAASPFWLYETWMAGQWGMFGLSFIYALCWARGIYTYWWRPRW